MWLFVLLLCLSVYSSCADGQNQNIKINIVPDHLGDLTCEGAETKVLVNTPFKVYLNYTEKIYRIGCHIEILKKTVPKLWAVGDGKGYLPQEDLTVSKNGTWQLNCTFYRNKCGAKDPNICYYDNYQHVDRGVKCLINFDVLRAEQITSQPNGRLTVNREHFETNTIQIYYFYEGEPMNFNCQKISGGFVELAYKTKDGNSISTGLQPKSSVAMYLKLMKANEGTSLCCITTDELRNNQYVIEVQLRYQARSSDMFGFAVNGLILPPTEIENQEYKYEYKYYDNEPLSIGVVNGDQFNEHCEVEGKGVPSFKKHFSGNPNPFSQPVTTAINTKSNMSLTCTVMQTDNRESYHTITFEYYSPNFQPSIERLSMARILQQYSDTKSNRIQYYIGNEKVIMFCNFNNQRYKWSFTATDFKTETNPSLPKRSKNSFQLLPHIKNSTIVCKAPNSDKTTYLELIQTNIVAETTIPAAKTTDLTEQILRRKIPDKQEKETSIKSSTVPDITNYTSGPIDTTTTKKPSTRSTSKSSKGLSTKNSATTENDINLENHDKNYSTDIGVAHLQIESSGSTGVNQTNPTDIKNGISFGTVAAACVVAILIAAAILWTIMHLRRRKQRASSTEPSDVNYQNLPGHNKGTMPIPAQWNSNCDECPTNGMPNNMENIENMYTKPIPRSQRNLLNEPMYSQAHDSIKCEPTYASVQESYEKPTYASVQKTCAEPTYAEVGKNSEYQNMENIERVGNQITYAEVVPGSQRGVRAMRSSMLKEQNYANIKDLNNEQNYANCQELNANNVIDKVKYVNVNNQTEYAEPAYCEVNVVKK